MEQANKPEFVNKVAEIELVYKSAVKASERPKISSSKTAYELFLKYWDENKLEFVEEFKVILLNRSNKVLGICSLTTGGVAGTIADPKLVFTTALKANASYVMIAHNHPSGNLKPSKADEELTLKIREAGKFLDLFLLDHLIITAEGYYSFADEGLI
ncbi:MAG: JAB domain-containing protein [Bacteroidetes bacterium]|nr:JAB domain-containing protein [Bacteroidota bacterium]